MSDISKLENGHTAFEKLWPDDVIYRFLYKDDSHYRVQYLNIDLGKIIRDDVISEQKTKNLLQNQSFSFYKTN